MWLVLLLFLSLCVSLMFTDTRCSAVRPSTTRRMAAYMSAKGVACFHCRATDNIRWQRFIVYCIDELHNAGVSCGVCEESPQNPVQQHHHCKGLRHSSFGLPSCIVTSWKFFREINDLRHSLIHMGMINIICIWYTRMIRKYHTRMIRPTVNAVTYSLVPTCTLYDMTSMSTYLISDNM